jgi:hypothetical protein
MQRAFLPACVGLMLLAEGMGSCQTNPLAASMQDNTRETARDFVKGLRNADATLVRRMSATPSAVEARQLGEAALSDALAARHLHVALSERLGYVEQRPGIVGSARWLDGLENMANNGLVLRAGDRMCIGKPGGDGSIYLHKLGDAWRVELIATLVPEASGRATVDDPAVSYRFGVSKAVNEWMLQRILSGEFASKRDFDRACDAFWIKYLACIADGQEPREHLLPTLPPMPRDRSMAIDE